MLSLAVIPVATGAARLVEVFGGPRIMPDNPRIAGSPSPAVLHIVGGGVFLVLGALQFSPRMRQRHPTWHRRSGRALMLLGVTAALAALWMTLFYPRQIGTGSILHTMRLIFGTALAVTIILAFRAIKRRDAAQHRAWMIRAYAIALAAGTQAVTIGVGEAIFGKAVLTTDLSTSAGWIINLAVAEVIIRRPSAQRPSAGNLGARSGDRSPIPQMLALPAEVSPRPATHDNLRVRSRSQRPGVLIPSRHHHRSGPQLPADTTAARWGHLHGHQEGLSLPAISGDFHMAKDT
jgi:hypothetical protein